MEFDNVDCFDLILVNIDTMEGMSGKMACASMKEGGMISMFEDELDIVEEGEIDDDKEEKHVGSPLPSIQMENIVQRSGLSRLEWMNVEVVLLNENQVVDGICCNTHPHDCVGQNPASNGDVGVVILQSLVHSNVHPTQIIFLYRWRLWNVMLIGS